MWRHLWRRSAWNLLLINRARRRVRDGVVFDPAPAFETSHARGLFRRPVRLAPISPAWSRSRAARKPSQPSPRPRLSAPSPLSRNGRLTAKSGYGSTRDGCEARSDAPAGRELQRRDPSSGGGPTRSDKAHADLRASPTLRGWRRRTVDDTGFPGRVEESHETQEHSQPRLCIQGCKTLEHASRRNARVGRRGWRSHGPGNDAGARSRL
jgi:hypothetical protein